MVRERAEGLEGSGRVEADADRTRKGRRGDAWDEHLKGGEERKEKKGREQGKRRREEKKGREEGKRRRQEKKAREEGKRRKEEKKGREEGKRGKKGDAHDPSQPPTAQTRPSALIETVALPSWGILQVVVRGCSASRSPYKKHTTETGSGRRIQERDEEEAGEREGHARCST
jgi:hypothetical protein